MSAANPTQDPTPELTATPAERGGPEAPRLLEPELAEPPIDAARRAALEAAAAYRRPQRMAAAEALALVEASPESGSRAVAAAARDFWAREAATERFERGGPGGCRIASNLLGKLLDGLAGAAERAELERRRVEGDEGLSPLGKRRAHEQVAQQLGDAAAAALGEAVPRAEGALTERVAAVERALERRLGLGEAEAPAEPPRVEAVLLAALLGGGTLGEDRVAELVQSAAAAGDGPLAAALLETFAKVARDPLRLEAVAHQVEARTDAIRRRRLLDDREALGLAAELAELRRVLAGVRALRGFLAARPGEVGLARDRLAALFAPLGGS